LIIEGMY